MLYDSFGGPLQLGVVLVFRMSVCRSFWIFGCSLISHELLDKGYKYAHHQNELNEEITIICFISRFNVYFSRNQRKCSQNGEGENLKI